MKSTATPITNLATKNTQNATTTVPGITNLFNTTTARVLITQETTATNVLTNEIQTTPMIPNTPTPLGKVYLYYTSLGNYYD